MRETWNKGQNEVEDRTGNGFATASRQVDLSNTYERYWFSKIQTEHSSPHATNMYALQKRLVLFTETDGMIRDGSSMSV